MIDSKPVMWIRNRSDPHSFGCLNSDQNPYSCILYSKVLYKMGHYFLDIQYNANLT